MNDKTRLKKVLLKTITDKNGCINFTGMSKGGYGRIKVMKSKNYNNKIVRHGDVIIRPLEMTSLQKIPTEAKDSGNMVVMHGESGNTHMIKNGQVLLLESPIEIQIPSGTKQVEKFLHIPQDTIITHEEHPTLTVKAGDYLVLQEREMDHMSEVERTVLD